MAHPGYGPSQLANLYDKVTTTKPLPNALGFLQRIPGQKYYRPAPNGKLDLPYEYERNDFGDMLMLEATMNRLRS